MDWESAMTGFVLAYYGTERESTMTAQEILDKINSAAAQCEHCGRKQTLASYCVISDGEHHSYGAGMVTEINGRDIYGDDK